MTSYKTLVKKANRLLAEGDKLMKTKPAEGRRILRKCRRFRMKAKEQKIKE